MQYLIWTIKSKTPFLTLLVSLYINMGLAQSINRAKVDSLMDVMADKAMLSIALSQNGELIYSRAIGYSDADTTHKVHATINTRYRIGSISKVFTSVIIFQMIEEGKIQLFNPLSEYFPDLPNAKKITIGNLLNHSSGLHNFTDDSSYTSMQNKKATKAEMLSKFKEQVPDFEPNSKHQYSNTNFILLGYIAEILDNKPYAEIVQQRICRTIGLKNTYYGGKINTKNQEAQSYTWQGRWVPVTETDMSIPGGAGALVSNPSDLNFFMTALFNGKLVNDNSLRDMITIKDGYGMDLVQYTFDGKTGYGHNGGIDGFKSQAVYYPQEKLAVSYTANGVNTSISKMIVGILNIYFNNK